MTYGIFCLATAIMASFTLIRPVINALEKEHPLNSVVQNKFIAYITFFLIAMLVAPLVAIVAIIPNMGERFKESLEESLTIPV